MAEKKQLTQDELKNMYYEVMNKTRDFLKENQEWERRYQGYYDVLFCKKSKEKHKRVKVIKPLYKYTTITDEKEQSASIILRYQGQEVGRVKEIEGNTYLQIDGEIAKSNEKYFGKPEKNSVVTIGTSIKAGCNGWEWKSEKAKDFRRYFTDYDKEKSNNPEHKLESEFLTELSKKKSNNKSLLYIQPILLNDKRFQMPTPLAASKIKNNINNLQYSGQHGGGIDVLARRKKGAQSYLTVIELKDEFNRSESPEKVMKQVIAYATFIRELVRSGTANEKGSWYREMGFSKDIKKGPITIYCVVAMPNVLKNTNINQFNNMFLSFNDGSLYAEDKLELHCISICEKDGKIQLVGDETF